MLTAALVVSVRKWAPSSTNSAGGKRPLGRSWATVAGGRQPAVFPKNARQGHGQGQRPDTGKQKCVAAPVHDPYEGQTAGQGTYAHGHPDHAGR